MKTIWKIVLATPPLLLMAFAAMSEQTVAASICRPASVKDPRNADASVTHYFSKNYVESREKFHEAAAARGLTVESFLNPRAGPDGERLYTDVALKGPTDAKTVLVLSSGTHGVEGFAGSAIQTGLLHEGVLTRLPRDTAVLMIHAINPYGMAHLRRFNEDNVDFNRNFIDRSKPYPTNRSYDALAEWIETEDLSFWNNFKARAGIAWYRLTRGKNWLQQAVSQGQYDHPQGLFYGGRSDAWSNLTLHEIAAEHLSTAKRVVLIDVHTGLGLFGEAELITNDRKGSIAFRRAKDLWGECVKSTGEDSVSPIVHGALKVGFQQMLPDAQVTAASLEFGTYPAHEVFWALRAENWLHHRGGDNHPKAGAIKTELKEKFYPDSDAWKVQVWQKGKNVFNRTLEALE